MICCPSDDDDLSALLWAAGAYVLTYTAAVLLLKSHNPFRVERPLTALTQGSSSLATLGFDAKSLQDF